jgi:hypothetical protein
MLLFPTPLGTGPPSAAGQRPIVAGSLCPTATRLEAAGVSNSRLNAPWLRPLERIVDHAHPVLRLLFVRGPFGVEIG